MEGVPTGGPVATGTLRPEMAVDTPGGVVTLPVAVPLREVAVDEDARHVQDATPVIVGVAETAVDVAVSVRQTTPRPAATALALVNTGPGLAKTPPRVGRVGLGLAVRRAKAAFRPVGGLAPVVGKEATQDSGREATFRVDDPFRRPTRADGHTPLPLETGEAVASPRPVLAADGRLVEAVETEGPLVVAARRSLVEVVVLLPA